MAMKIGGKYEPHDVHLRHWHRLVPDSATARKAMEKSLSDLARKTLAHATQLHADLKKDNITSPVIESILGIIKDRSARISAETQV